MSGRHLSCLDPGWCGIGLCPPQLTSGKPESKKVSLACETDEDMQVCDVTQSALKCLPHSTSQQRSQAVHRLLLAVLASGVLRRSTRRRIHNQLMIRRVCLSVFLRCVSAELDLHADVRDKRRDHP